MPGVSASPPQQQAARRSWFDGAAALFIAALVVIVVLTVSQYAISNDEQVQHRYGELILAYYASGLVDRAVFGFQNLYLYGGLFDIVAVLLGKLLPFDVYLMRHVLCAFIGVGGIVATWATARLIAGPRAGLIAAVALAVCGAWYGSMFNHTKDVPFAAAMMGASYFLLRATRDLPQPRLRHLFAFGVLLGCALGLRALGLLLPLFALAAVAIRLPPQTGAKPALRFLGHGLLLFVPAFAIGYLIMIAAWPWAALSLFNPIRGAFAFTHFAYPIKTLLDGATYLMGDVPRWYVPEYLAIKLPLVLFVGAALTMLLMTRGASSANAPVRRQGRETIFVAFIAIFPVICQTVAHGPAFTGMRHFTFVVPPLAVLAGVGLDAALTRLAARRLPMALATMAVAAGLLSPASELVRLHPYEYLYFNPLVGGLKGAAQRYDTDYWVNGMREMVADLDAYIEREGHGTHGTRPYFVAVCGERLSFEEEAKPYPRLKWANDNDPADFFIAPTHMHCDAALNGKVILRVERMGALIGVVKDRRAITEPAMVSAK